MFVNPRPHLAKWVQAVLAQMKMEGAGKVLLTCVAPREQVSAGRNICEVLPVLYPLFHTAGLSGKAWALGRRPKVYRLPDAGKRLPPERWTEEFLPSHQVLVVIEVEAGAGESRPTLEWIGEAAPLREDGGLEALVVETILAPGTKQGLAGQLLQTGVRKLARAAGLKAPLEVKGIRVSPGGTLAWGQINVPRGQGPDWLKASGAEGVMVRPFFTASTGEQCKRERFALRWLKKTQVGRQKIMEVWESVRAVKGVYGVVSGGADLAIRVDPKEVDLGALMAALGEKAVEVKERKEGLRWWCIENVEERDLWDVPELIAKFGMTPVGGWRFARGAFRSRIFFQAAEQPAAEGLDGGGWGDSGTRIRAADPPPGTMVGLRQQAKQGVLPRAIGLPSTATWGMAQAMREKALGRRVCTPAPTAAAAAVQPQSPQPPEQHVAAVQQQPAQPPEPSQQHQRVVVVPETQMEVDSDHLFPPLCAARHHSVLACDPPWTWCGWSGGPGGRELGWLWAGADTRRGGWTGRRHQQQQSRQQQWRRWQQLDGPGSAGSPAVSWTSTRVGKSPATGAGE